MGLEKKEKSYSKKRGNLMSKEVVVKEAMKTNLAIVDANTTVLEAAKIMKIRSIGNVIVVQKDQPIGILTESDIIKKVVADGKDAEELKVKDVMSKPVIVSDPYLSLIHI